MLRRMRLEERSVYAKVRDVFAISASDYDKDSPDARAFFAMAQDKFHFAATGKTAAELILDRADGMQDNMGLTYWKGQEHGVQLTLNDARIGKNYLNADELRILENISEQFLLFAESKAFRGHKMTMEELATRLNMLLMANDYKVLYNYPKAYLRDNAKKHAEKQYKAYRTRIGAPKVKPQLRSGRRKPQDTGDGSNTD